MKKVGFESKVTCTRLDRFCRIAIACYRRCLLSQLLKTKPLEKRASLSIEVGR